MLKPLPFKNKKSIEISLIHLIEIALAIMIVLVLLYLALKLTGLFLGRQEYDSAVNNLDALSIKVNELLKDKKDISYQTMVYSVPDSYILVGFSYNDKDITRTECTQEDIVKSRPKMCQSKSCLCIYKNFGGATDWKGKDFDEKGQVTPLKCKVFDEKISFLAFFPSSNLRGAQSQWELPYELEDIKNYQYLVVYGKCGLGPSWGIRQITLQKSKKAEDNLIIMKEMPKSN